MRDGRRFEAVIFDLDELAIGSRVRQTHHRAVINPRVPRDNAIRLARLENDSG